MKRVTLDGITYSVVVVGRKRVKIKKQSQYDSFGWLSRVVTFLREELIALDAVQDVVLAKFLAGVVFSHPVHHIPTIHGLLDTLLLVRIEEDKPVLIPEARLDKARAPCVALCIVTQRVV